MDLHPWTYTHGPTPMDPHPWTYTHGPALMALGWKDTENEHIYHKELFVLTKAKKDEPHELAFTIPLFEPLPPCYFVRAISNKWLGVETIVPLPLSELTLPTAMPPGARMQDRRAEMYLINRSASAGRQDLPRV